MVRLWQIAILILLAPIWCRAEDRYVAMFADGNRVQDAEIRDWNDPNSEARIHSRLLFDTNAPVRWILDRHQPVSVTPKKYVEFACGDRLAGEVVAYSNGLDNPYDLHPQYLVVKPAADLQPPDTVTPADVRVTTDWVQRIVWEQVGSDEYLPGTLRLKTGASVVFRSLRWDSVGITVLTNNGLKHFLMSELGELHLPKIDPWNAYFEQVAVLSPECKSRLIHMSCNDGSRWSTSFERFQSRSVGDRNRPDQWYQLIQPAWSLDPIWLKYRTIRNWRFFSPNEVPLSNLRPTLASHDAVFGQGFDWQVDQNVQQGRLQSLDREFGWGFGVHGTSELVFVFPEAVQAIRTKYGLDRTVGTGGCVNMELLNGHSQSLMKHLNLVGAKTVGDTEWLDLNVGRASESRITLRTEMAHGGRPVNADPFDIRDLVNWYEPEVRLNPVSMATEVATRSAAKFAVPIGWTRSPDDSSSMKVTNVFDNSDPFDPQFRLVVRSPTHGYTLSRNVKIGDRDRWLALVASRFSESSVSTVQIRIDGRSSGDFEVPVRLSKTDPEPMLVSVQLFQGKTVLVEVVVSAADNNSWIDWRGFTIAADRPGLLTIFEDDETFARLLNSGNGRVEVDTETRYSGTRSLKVTPGAGDNATIPGLDALICEYPRLGQYRYCIFAWKKTTGTRIQLQLADRGRLSDGRPMLEDTALRNKFPAGLRRTQTADERGRRFRYCYEEGVATTQTPTPLWMHGELPREWELVQRDLFNDFGVFSVTGLSLNCVDGDAAWFDHVYLARSKQDLEYAVKYLVNLQPVPSGSK